MPEHNHMDSVHADRGGDAEHGVLPERRSFDGLLLPFSTRCLNAPPDQLDREIKQGLHEVNSFFGGDRVILWEITNDESEAVITNSHTEAGANLPASSIPHKTLPYIFSSVRSLKNLCVSRLKELPQEALIDRQYLENSGIRSFMVIPLMAGGILQGALSLACIRTERAWSAEDLSRFQRIGSILSSALDRQRSHHLLVRRMQFEALVTDLSAQLIKAPVNEVDGEIEQALARVREIFQADRCCLLDIRINHKFCLVTHASNGEGIEPVSGDINLAELFPWCYEQLTQGKPINLCRVEDYPEDALMDRQSHAALGIKSALNIPLSGDGRISRTIVINHTRRHQTWPEEYIPRLRLLGEVFVNALERRKDRLKLEEELRFKTLLSEISARFVNLPADQVDSEIMDAERRICELIGLDISALWQWSGEPPGFFMLTHYYSAQDGPQPSMRLNETDFPWFRQLMLEGRIVPISSLDEMPEEAALDQENCRKLGVKSNLCLPLIVGRRPIGILGLNTTLVERTWPDTLVKWLQLVAQIFANALIRKQTETALQESEARLSMTTDAVGAGLWIMEVDTKKVWVSPKSRELFHFAPDEEVCYESYFRVIHPEDRDRVHQEVQQAIQSGKELRCDYRILLPDGTLRWIAARGQRFLKSAGAAERLMGLSLDITEGKQAEEALEDRLRFEGLVADLSARFLNVPPEQVDLEIAHALHQIREFFRFDRIGLVRLSPQEGAWQVTHVALEANVVPVPVGVDLPAALFPWVFEKLATHHESLSFSSLDEFPPEAAIDRQTCEEWDIKSYLCIPTRVAASFVYAVVINSVTAGRLFPADYIPRIRLLGEILLNALERKQAEAEAARSRAELLHVERSMHLIELTGSLAHELNQPLAAILSNAQAALRFLKSDKPDLNEFQEIIQDIIADDQRAGNVIRSLRSMLKREEGEKSPILLNEILYDVLRIFRGEAIFRNVHIETEWDESLPPVLADKGQLQQVVLNFILNGAEAMSRNQADQRKLILQTHRKDSNIRMTVRDFGPGIDKENLERVFQPFFTTKSTGLGMGLAICNSIIKAHRGRLWAENNPDGGASFIFELPIYKSGKVRG